MMRRAAVSAAALLLAACGGHASAPAPRPLAQSHVPSTAPKAERVTIAPASASPVTFARMARHIEPGLVVPRQPQHAPGGKSITFLWSEHGDNTMSLFSFDLATGKTEVLVRGSDLAGAQAASLSREEELRRERQRDRNEGITGHVWARGAPLLVVPHAGDIFVRDFAAGAGVVRLTKTPAPEIDPKPCDTGKRVAFVRDGELFTIDVATRKETALTRPLGEGITHGLSDFVAQEELGESSGFFWSPTCDRIAYLEVDERPVDRLPVLGYRGEPDLMMQRYPRAGAKNPVVRAGIVDVATRKTTWLDLPDAKAERYLGRFTWSADGTSLFVQSLSRDQKRRALLRFDARTGTGRELAMETSPAWVSFSPMKLVGSSELVFASTQTGHRHLEVRRQEDGALVRTLTHGDWDAESIAAIDVTGRRVLFTGTKESPLERHLYAVPLAGGDVIRLTPERGVHGVKVDEQGKTWFDVHSANDRPPTAVVVTDGKVAGNVALPVDPEIASLGLRPIENVVVPGSDGTPLHASLLRPRTITGRHPVVVVVYGGPEAQSAYESWSPRLLWQHLADRGFVVFQLDNRGSGGRGPAFAQKVHKQLGKLELEDQLAGARWLASQPYVDGSRIGIYGHSYGGFMAALAMLEGHGVFRAGVSGSPVTDWRLYDTGYTERYMETPQSNPDGYAWADLSKKAAGLQGKLLLTHSMMDENVHYAHTARLIDALVAADKPFELLVLPGERHGVRAPAARAYVPERIATFFAENL